MNGENKMVAIKTGTSKYDIPIELKSEPLANAVKVAQDYFVEKQALETTLSNARKEYQGERLQQELNSIQEIKVALKKYTFDNIDNCFSDMIADIVRMEEKIEKRTKEMRADLITDDLKFLQSSMLTQEELQKLCDRHPDNTFFNREARQYANTHKLKIITAAERIEAEKRAINEAIGSLAEIIRIENQTQLQIFIKSGHMVKCDTNLSDKIEGFYEKPCFHEVPILKLNFDDISKSDIQDPDMYTQEQHDRWRKHHGYAIND